MFSMCFWTENFPESQSKITTAVFSQVISLIILYIRSAISPQCSILIHNDLWLWNSHTAKESRARGFQSIAQTY